MALLTGLLGTILATVLIGGAMLGAWMLGRHRRRDTRDDLADVNRRLAHLEGLVEGLTREVERLAENQQFTLRLLGKEGKVETRGRTED